MAERESVVAPQGGDPVVVSSGSTTGGSLQSRGGSELVTETGRTSIADAVVAKIAGVAAREVNGVHEMGKGAARAFGALKGKLPVGSSTPAPAQGVSVEVGERQAAVDLDLVTEYGVNIPDVAQSVRENVISRVEGMTGLEVTEVNVTVDDVWLPDQESQEPSRVQ